MIDYRVIDEVNTNLDNLHKKVENRHAYIAALNAKKQPGEKEVTKNVLLDADIQEYTTQVAKDVRNILLDVYGLVVENESYTLSGYVISFFEKVETVAPLLDYDTAASRIWENSGIDYLLQSIKEVTSILRDREHRKNAAAALLHYFELHPQENTQSLTLFFQDPINKLFEDVITPEFFYEYKRQYCNYRNGIKTPPESIPAANTQARQRYYLTTVSPIELQSIYDNLVDKGYIEEGFNDFINAFNKNINAPQGKITWIKKTSKNKRISIAALLDFVTMMSARSAICTDDIKAINAIFNITVNNSQKCRFNGGHRSEYYPELSDMIC